MIKFVVRLLGAFAGILAGLIVVGSPRCVALVVLPNDQVFRFAGANAELVTQALVEGGELVQRCSVGGATVDFGTFGFFLFSWGTPLLFAVLAWLAIGKIWDWVARHIRNS